MESGRKVLKQARDHHDSGMVEDITARRLPEGSWRGPAQEPYETTCPRESPPRLDEASAMFVIVMQSRDSVDLVLADGRVMNSKDAARKAYAGLQTRVATR